MTLVMVYSAGAAGILVSGQTGLRMLPGAASPIRFSLPATGLSRMGCVCALALLTVSMPRAFEQLDRQPPLTPGPASVMLVATLESLSVGAAPPLVQNAAAQGQPVAITTSWAVPANLTTLRLVGYLEDDPKAAQASALLQAGGEAIPLFTETAGKSNLPATRIDRLNIAMDWQDAAVHAAGNKGVLSILVQAL